MKHPPQSDSGNSQCTVSARTDSRAGERGASITEYVLIVALVLLAVVAAMSLLGRSVRDVLNAGASALVTGQPLTPLGSTFPEISGGMAALLQEYFELHGRWPRSWGDYAYTDIGLDPATWRQSYNGVIYKPVGNRIQVAPAEGYSFQFRDVNGTTVTLSWKTHWNLIYYMPDGTWHYHTTTGVAVRIDTLKVIPPAH